jgi:hypothetical protein
MMVAHALFVAIRDKAKKMIPAEFLTSLAQTDAEVIR